MTYAVCFGEALVDLLPDRRGRIRDCERFEVHSGGALACVTLGARGAMARRGLESAQVPAPRVEAVDTTGAGDGFVAGPAQ